MDNPRVAQGESGVKTESIIDIDGLCYTYPDGHQALRGVDLVVHAGETVAFIGPNGAGKSTLLLHLNGILRGNDGAVRILDVPVDDRHRRWIRSKVGVVFQDPEDQLFSPTVFEDVAFGPLNLGWSAEEVRQRVGLALLQVGMSASGHRSPHHLSMGEKKRVAIATVLSMDPEVLVLDEPASNLDPGGRWDLIQLVRRLPLTKIVASHDLEMVQALCERTILLDEGRVVADDLTPRILSDLPLLASHNLAPPVG